MNSKFPTISFSKKEGWILNTLWNAPDRPHDTYRLVLEEGYARMLNTPEAEKVFAEMEQAIEHLIEHDLLRGTRLKDAAGRIYFSDMKLTNKGERETIRYRREQDAMKGELAGAVERSDAVTEEILRASGKK